MADLNPLKFLVAIQDDATGQLNEIQKKLETLKEHTIKLKVEGKEEIHTAFNIDKLVEQIQNAKRALSGDSFEKFSTYMTNAAESVDKLTEAFVKFKSTIGSNQDLKDMLSGWGAAIREINAAMAAVNAAKSSAGGKKGASGQTTDELKQQEQGLVKVADAIGRVRSAMASGGASGGIPFLENINVIGERNIQTLIKEQGHIERLIAIAKKSIDFGEGHPVLGMGRLRGDQMRNLQDLEALKKVITEILFAANQGDQAMIRFLNTSSALRTTPFGKDAMGNDVTLLGGHFDKLTHSVTGTASAMRNLNNEMRLDSNVWPNAEQESNTRRYNQLLADAEKLLRRIDEAGSKGSKLGLDTSLSRVGSRDVSMFLDKALKFEDMGNFRALNELIGQFQRLKAVYGEVAKEQEKMNTSRVAAGEKADAQYMKEVEAYTKRCIQEYNNWQESIRRAGVEATNLKVKLRELENVERRGQSLGVDTTTLKSRIQALRQELSILQEINGGSKAYGLTKDYVKTEAYHERVKLAQEEMRIVAKASTEKERSDNKAIKDLETIETNQRRYNQLLSEAQSLMERLSSASTKGNGLFLDVSKAETALNQLQQHIDRVLNFDTRNLRDNHAVSELIANWNALKKSLQSVAKEQERLNTTQEKANKSSTSATAKQAQQENDKWAESMRRASIEATKLKIQIDKLREIEATGRHTGVDTSSLSAKIAELNALRQTLLSMSFGAKIHGTAGDLINSAAFQNTTRLANQEADAVKKSAQEKERAAMVTQQLTAEQQRLSQALSQTTDHMRSQSQLLSDLKSLATQYLGVWGGQQFLNNIIQIGGQLEMQRLSIGAILQNQAQANTLFNQIKGLATQSPFGVVELDQMTKQLTAYGFKYHELFDMTKRLADISAATGTSVDRLALALGHVRSEAALSGYTLRQFSMGNVPLLQKLSEKLGKTTKEIRDMVKKKEISYDDVVGVLKDLTNEGGMFYNMQEVISQSVKAKFKNVKDAMDIMYGEMAEGGIGDALKGVASVLMEMTRNWKDVATVMGTVAVLWGVHRAAVMVYTQTLGAANAQTMASIVAHRQKEAAMLREAQVYRTLTASEQTQLAASRAMTVGMRTRMALGMQLTMTQRRRLLVSRQQQVMDMALALSEKKLTVEHIARQVALGRLSKAQARTVIQLAELSVTERQAAMNAINGTRQIGMFSMAIWNMGNSALGALAKLGKFLLNPQMLIMAGITAAMELWQRNSREVERAEEVADSIYQHSQDAIRNTKTMMQNDMAPLSFVDKNGSDVNTIDLGFNTISDAKIKFPEVDRSQMQRVLDEWTTYIENYAVNAGQILNQASLDAQGNLLPLEERFNNLKKAIEEVVLAQYGLQDMGDVFANAIKTTNGGWFDEDVLTDIGDYDKKIRSFSSNVATAYRKYQKAIDDGVKAALKQSESFAKATKDMDTYGQMFDLLMKKQGEFPDAFAAFRSVEGTGDATFDINESLFNTTSGDMNRAKQEMLAELDSFYVQVEAEMQTKGVDLSNLTTQQQQAMLLGYKKQLESVQGLSKETMEWLMQMFAQHFDIPLSLDDSKFIPKVNEVTETLNNLVEGDWKVDLDFVEHINDAIDEARKKYKLAKEYFEKTEKIRLKFGIDLKLGQLMDDKTKQSVLSKIENEDIRKEVEKVINGLNQASTAFNKSTEASRNLGFSLEDEKKGKKKTGAKKTGTGTKAYKDEFAKRWDERIRIMKEAYDWYDKWEKKVGNEAAIEETNAKYADIFREWKTDKLLPMDFDVKEIADYTKYVEKIRDDALARYQAQKNDKGKNNGQEALRVYRQAVALLNDVKFDNFSKAAEEFKSIIEQTISDLNNRWDIFNTVRSATGDVALASRVAGFGVDEMKSRTSADAMREELIRQLRGAGGEELVSAIPLDTHLDEESIRNMLENAIPSSENAEEYKNKIDGLIRSYQEWQKLQQQVYKADISVFANLIGSVVSYDAKVNKLNDDLRKQKESISAALASGAINQEDADMANAIAEAKFDWDSMKLSADYANIYNNAIAMSREEFDEASNAIERLLKRLRELELISDEDYLSEIDKLNKARKEWSETGFLGERGAVGSFISGGNEGLLNYYAERRDKAKRKAAQYKEGSEENEKWKAEADHYGDLFNKLSKLSDAAKDVVTAFQTLQSGLDLVTNLFDSLGMEGAANVAGDAGGILGGALQGASSLSALGPWGMAAGAAVGLVSGIAQTHDKSLERQIGKLREDVQRIEANTKLIQQARERTLGLDNGILRRLYAQQYESSTSKAQRDMYDYYSRNSSGNGYQQEFNNLIQQRQDYLSILDKQESKKKKSQSDIEETKSKIAELDDQIRFFSQDLAKELWDIDIKGWADQLSDALASAFENGENMAKAYKDTVKSILQTVLNDMLRMKIIEPMLKSLEDKLFGDKGAFDPNDIEGSMSKVMATFGEYFGEGGEGQKMITAANEMMTSAQRALEPYGLSVYNDSGKTLSSSVQGTSEETSNLLAAYVNALRQDVSINRLLLTEFVAQLWPSYLEEFTNHVRTVARIDNNVQVMMEMMRDGRGAMYEEIHSLRSRIDNVVNGIESFAMK